MEEKDDGQSQEKRTLFPADEGKEEASLKEDKKEGQSIDARCSGELKEGKILCLTVTHESPGKTSQDMGSCIFHGHPDEGSQEKAKPREKGADLGMKEGEKSPEKRHQGNEKKKNEETQGWG